jgi:ketosteroid isomerase-like protein
METATAEREIRTLEDRRYQAMLDGDAETLAPLLAEELVYTHSTGTADTKATYLAGVRAKTLTYRGIERPEEAVRVYGETAVVSGRARIDVLVGDVPRQAQVRYLAVWTRATHGWQLVAFQATPITA